MSSYKHHIKTDHDGDVENFRTARKDLQKLKERGDDLTAADLMKFLDRLLGGLESHKSSMSQMADILPQGHLVAPLEAGQPYVNFGLVPENPALARKAAGLSSDAGDDIVNDHVRMVIGPPIDEGLTMITRKGQPNAPQRANVDPRFERFVKVEDEERPA